jgi:transposase
MIRMLIVGYVFAIRSERAICREVQVNLAYRWFCGLSIEDSRCRRPLISLLTGHFGAG